jgi:hypothetical protein
MQRQMKALGIAGLGQQLLRAIRIKRLGLDVRIMAEHAWTSDLTGGDRDAIHETPSQRIAVDRLGDRLTHTSVAQRIGKRRLAIIVGHEWRNVATAVEREQHNALAGAHDDVHLGVRLQAADVGRRHIVDHVHFVVEQSRDARRACADHPKNHPIPIRRLPPVVGVAFQYDLAALDPIAQLVWPGADRCLA